MVHPGRVYACLFRPEGCCLVMGDHAVTVDHWLGRTLGCGPAEIVNAYGLLAWQALGTQPSRAEIPQACADLRGSGPVGAENVNVCGLPASQALGTKSSGDHAV
jgi:hypothetical protein